MMKLLTEIQITSAGAMSKQKLADEVYETFADFRWKAELLTGRTFKILRPDDGKEFTNIKLQDLLRRMGIHHQMTVMSEQYGLTDRGNRIIVKRARCILLEALMVHIPKQKLREEVRRQGPRMYSDRLRGGYQGLPVVELEGKEDQQSARWVSYERPNLKRPKPRKAEIQKAENLERPKHIRPNASKGRIT